MTRRAAAEPDAEQKMAKKTRYFHDEQMKNIGDNNNTILWAPLWKYSLSWSWHDSYVCVFQQTRHSTELIKSGLRRDAVIGACVCQKQYKYCAVFECNVRLCFEPFFVFADSLSPPPPLSLPSRVCMCAYTRVVIHIAWHVFFSVDYCFYYFNLNERFRSAKKRHAIYSFVLPYRRKSFAGACILQRIKNRIFSFRCARTERYIEIEFSSYGFGRRHHFDCMANGKSVQVQSSKSLHIHMYITLSAAAVHSSSKLESEGRNYMGKQWMKPKEEQCTAKT